MVRKIIFGISAFALLSIIALGVAFASPAQQSDTTQDPFEFMIKALADANDNGALSGHMRDRLAEISIEWLIAPHTGETPEQVEERLSNENQTRFEFLIAVLTDAKDKGVWDNNLSEFLADYFTHHLIAPHTGETPEQVRSRLSAQLEPTPTRGHTKLTPTPEPLTDATLSNLSVRGTDFNQPFSPNRYSYTLGIPYFIDLIGVSATTNHSGASYVILKVDGIVDSDGLIPLDFGRNVIEVRVTAENGVNALTYTIVATREEANFGIRSLSLSGVTLNPPFTSDRYSYTARVPNDFHFTQVSVIMNHPDASYEIRRGLGGPVDSDGLIGLSLGENVIDIVGISPDGERRAAYIIRVTREDTPDARTPSAPKPTSTPTPVPTSESTPIPTPTPESTPTPLSPSEPAPGPLPTSAPPSLEPTLTPTPMPKSTPTPAPTSTPTPDPAQTDITISGLSISWATLSPSFSSGIYAYTASVPNDVYDVQVSVTMSQPGASYEIRRGPTGPAIPGNRVSLSVGQNDIYIWTTSTNGEENGGYIVWVTRAGS